MTDKEKILDGIKSRCLNCTACPLCETRTNVVFGRGNIDADILFIGEAPGEKEDLSGEPFVGAAGKLLDKFLVAVGLSENDYYIANIIKCRPPKNRDPKPEEEDACIGFLKEQLMAIKPKIIVCLGRISAKRIIKEDFKITEEHGKWFKKGNFLITAVFHPAAILRDPRRKQAELEDFEKIAEMKNKISDII
ncbi:MAG: uracil-DNA glycosylase [Clostridia bacterium]|nr:uracil-DNA glycosylase [Clostridia bacterium]